MRGPVDAAKAGQEIADTAIPIAKKHAQLLLITLAAELANDPAVREALSATVLVDVVGNPEVASMAKDALLTLVQNNPLVHQRLEGLVEDSRLGRALYDLAEEAGPLVLQMGRLAILDDAGSALHPAVAQLVRMRILEHGACWIGIRLGGGPPMRTSERPQVLLYSGTRREVWEDPLTPSTGEGRP